jgi:DNA helicase-2/ATP-dependent DNA helicase PcrA
LADTLFPGEPATVSKNEERTGHDGIFWLPASEVDAYIERYSPQVLRLSVATNCMGYRAMNYGASKGMTFKRVLIFPHKGAEKWLVSGDISFVAGSAAKLYVGITRARHSVAFVCAGQAVVKGAQRVDLSLPSVGDAEGVYRD